MSRRVPRSLILALEIVLVAGVAYFAWRALRGQWSEVSRIASDVRPDWPILGAATVLVLATYIMLIEVWRRMVLAWGETLGFADAARIWFVSSLARYIPGKLWQVGAMGVMAQRAGVSPVAASGSALIATVANLLAGACVILITGSRVVEPYVSRGAAIALVLAGLLLVAVPLLLPQIARLASSVTGREIRFQAIPASALWLAFFGSVLSWLAYGVAFYLLTMAVLGKATGTVGAYIAVYTASYLVGFLALFAPGGVVVRETAMIPLMQSLGLATAPQALVVAVTSRLWLTLVELGPGLLMLAATRRGGRTTPNGTDAT